MSKNAKQRNKAALAVTFTKTRKSGSKGPKRTTKVTKKKNTWFSALARKAPVATATPESGEVVVISPDGIDS